MKPQLTITQVQPKGPSVVALLGDGIASVTLGSGWNVIDRPKRKGFTTWDGYPPLTMEVPIVLDGFATNASVEPGISDLYAMMRDVDDSVDESPVLRLSGPVPYTGLRWVITDLSSSEEIRRPSDGKRVRAKMTVKLMEYVAADVMKTKKASPAKAAKSRKSKKDNSKDNTGAKSSGRTYKVKRGDTLGAIAVKFLGSAGEWHKIATMNNIRDPKKLKVGQVLRIPAK